MAASPVLDKSSAVKIQPPPESLEREPLVAHQRGIGWVSDRIASVIEGETPAWWKICFAISLGMMTLCFTMILYLMSLFIKSSKDIKATIRKVRTGANSC